MSESADERELLVAEYVLGTLAGQARADFEQRLANDASLQRLLAVWQERLVGFDQSTPPREVPARVWHALEARLDAQAGKAARGPWWRSLMLWRSLTAAAVLGLALVVITPLLLPGDEPQAVDRLVMQEQDQSPQWVLLAEWDQRRMTVTRVGAAPLSDQDYELWLLPSDGGAPVSMGVMRGAQTVASLPAGFAPEQVKAFAMSLEPYGGSPSGAPTGPVLYVAAMPQPSA